MSKQEPPQTPAEALRALVEVIVKNIGLDEPRRMLIAAYVLGAILIATIIVGFFVPR